MRRAAGISWSVHLLAGAALVLEVGAIAVLAIEVARGTLPPLDQNTAGGYALGATFPIVGWIIARRRPGNAIGWIFLTIGLSQALATFVGQYSTYGLTMTGASLPFAAELAWVGVWSWAPGFVLLLTLSLLLFPDGRLPSPRWRPVLWATIVALLLITVPIAVATWPLRGLALALPQNEPSTDPTMQGAMTLEAIGLILAATAALASVVGLVVRFRRSAGVERRQLKWFTFGGAVEISFFVVMLFFSFGTPAPPAANGLIALVSVVVAPLLPVAAAIAILRYRLYEIDRIVSRTVSYSIVTAVLGGLFVGMVLLLQKLLAPFTSGQTIAVAASTLVSATLFQPLRRRVQAAVDRHFNRSRYDAERTADAFASQLRDNVDVGMLGAEVRGVIAQTLAPMVIGVWIRGADPDTQRALQVPDVS